MWPRAPRRHRKQARNPARSASAARAKNTQRAWAGVRAGRIERQ
jgi:hypothetical protein